MPDPEEIRRLHQQEQSAESGRELGLYTAAVFKGLLEGGLSESAPSNWSPPTSRRWSCADRTRRARADSARLISPPATHRSRGVMHTGGARGLPRFATVLGAPLDEPRYCAAQLYLLRPTATL